MPSAPVRTLLASLVFLSAAFAWSSLASPLAALAARPRANDSERAVELFKRSEEHYRQGRFREAADDLREAYRLRPDPVLLYNLARAYEGLGDLKGAIAAYTKYLEREPHVPDRGAIEKKIATLTELAKRAGDEPGAARTAPPVAPETPPAAAAPATTPPPAVLVGEPEPPRVVPWVLAGAGAVGLALGAGLGIAALDQRSSAEQEPIHEIAYETDARAGRFATASSVAWIAGGALATAALVWLVFGSEP